MSASKRALVVWVCSAVVSCALLFFLGCTKEKNLQDGALSRCDSLSLSHSSTSDSLVRLVACAVASLGAGVDTAFDRFQNRIIEEAATLPAISAAMPDTACVAALLQRVFDEWQLSFDPADSTIEASLPHRVYAKKKGGCLGIALLMLLVAEAKGYPLYGVVIPGHIFLRYDDGTIQRNIEPNARGIERMDHYYRERYAIERDSWYYPLRNRSKKEVAGVLWYALGMEADRRGSPKTAAAYFRTARRLFPEFPSAWGNAGLVFARLRMFDSAFACFDRVRLIDPADCRVLYNRGALLISMRRLTDADSFIHELRDLGKTETADSLMKLRTAR